MTYTYTEKYSQIKLLNEAEQIFEVTTFTTFPNSRISMNGKSFISNDQCITAKEIRCKDLTIAEVLKLVNDTLIDNDEVTQSKIEKLRKSHPLTEPLVLTITK